MKIYIYMLFNGNFIEDVVEIIIFLYLKTIQLC